MFKARWRHAYDTQAHPDTLPGGIRQFNGYRQARLYALLRQSIQQATADWQGWRVLDAGCGSGDTGGFLAAHNSVTGVDFSRQMLHYAQRVYPSVALADVEALPFAAGSFDGLLAVGLWQCLPADTPFLGEVARVLRPGGAAVLGWVLNRDFLLYRGGVRFRLDPSVSMTLYAAGEIAPRLAAAGLRLTACYGALFPLGVVGRIPAFLRPFIPAFTVQCVRD